MIYNKLAAGTPITRPMHPNTASAGALVLGAYLRRIRGQAGLSVQQAATALRRTAAAVTSHELGISPLDERNLAALISLYGKADDMRHAEALRAHATDDELRSPTPLPPHCLEALEEQAKGLTVFTARPIPPTLYSPALQAYKAQQDHAFLPAPRPLPDCPITLLLDVSVLFVCLPVPELLTDQLSYWRDLAESGSLEIRLVPQELFLPQGSQLVSEITLSHDRQIWVDEGLMPAFSTGDASSWRSGVIRRAREEAYSPDESLNGVRDAVRTLSRARGAAR
ncbi:helix-turn-helix domain-containing protein [Streptomyces sp. NPDC001568]|uniref:helix-turn-helix domain-containing protein n=1 Tax=Streptomyces sp. NPDC001568 TaxID=3364588 RepID=UPI0036AD32C2